MREVVIVDMARSGVGRHGGTVKDVPAVELLTQVARALVERNKAKVKYSLYDYVLIGQVKQNCESANIARNVALNIGLPEETPAATLTMACGSGLVSIEEGTEMIRTGYADVILAGGVESMSHGEYFLSYDKNQAFGTQNVSLNDTIIVGGPGAAPSERYGNIPMGITAENLVDKWNIPRQEQDEFGLRSQTLAIKAINEGLFEKEIVPIQYTRADGTTGLFAIDEYPMDTNMEKLGKLKPSFKKDGTVTAGNSSGRNDGASVCLLMSKEKAEELGVKARARFVSAGLAGVDPTIMGRGPVPAVEKALEKAGIKFADLDAIELNEAFAGQSLAVYCEWKEMYGVDNAWLDSHVNLWGGAIAIGHPLGASGCIITTKLLYGLERTKGRYGLTTMCCGGGIGAAGIIERLD